jgi:hypothetical protein
MCLFVGEFAYGSLGWSIADADYVWWYCSTENSSLAFVSFSMDYMKLSKKTLNILKNFATINQTFHIKKGSKISVMFDDCVFAKAEVEETFPNPVLIYDMNKLLGTLSLFSSPNVEFEDKQLIITEGPHTVTYRYGDPFIVREVPEVKAVPDKVSLECELSDQVLVMAQKAAALFSIKTFSIVGTDGKATLMLGDTKTDTYQHELGDCTDEFDYKFTLDNLKIMPETYTMVLGSKKGSGMMSMKAKNVEYVFAANKDSVV